MRSGNLFSQFLRSLLPADRQVQVEAFVERWDALEELVIRVYQQGEATPADEAVYAELKQWFEVHYPELAGPLRRHWPETTEAGHRPTTDPFQRLFSPESATVFVDNWPAMQALPAAREALNRYLLELRDDG